MWLYMTGAEEARQIALYEYQPGRGASCLAEFLSGFRGYLQTDGRAERSIKPFVMGRKNFLFANTPRGAKTSAVIYNVIETAKANALDPYRYLLFLLEELPNADRRPPTSRSRSFRGTRRTTAA
jgi:hypothetical protein